MITVIFLIIFAIISVNMFKGKFWDCHLDPSESKHFGAQGVEIKNKFDCINYGGMWKKDDNNFDSTIDAMLTLFRMSLEAWTDEMYLSQRVGQIGEMRDPTRKNYSSAFFFIIFMILYYFFILNLF